MQRQLDSLPTAHGLAVRVPAAAPPETTRRPLLTDPLRQGRYAQSLLSDAGVALEEVADRLGHKDTRMASLHYRHRVRPTVSAGHQMDRVIRSLRSG